MVLQKPTSTFIICNMAPHSLVTTILHEFHDSRCHQGTIHTFEVIRRCYWWPKLQHDIVKYKASADITKLPKTVLAMDTIGYLSITSKGNRGPLQQFVSTNIMCSQLP